VKGGDDNGSRSAGELSAGDWFEKEHLQPHRLTIEDFERYLRHEAAIQQLITSAAVSARLLNPREAEILYRKEHEEVATDVALFSATKFSWTTSSSRLPWSAIITARAWRCTVCRSGSRSATWNFAATNYFSEADKQIGENTNLSAPSTEYYFSRRIRNPSPTAPVFVLSEAEAKAKIKRGSARRLGFDLCAAKKQASSGPIWYNQQANSADLLDKLAAAKGLAVKVTPPFDRQRGAEDSDLPPNSRSAR